MMKHVNKVLVILFQRIFKNSVEQLLLDYDFADGHYRRKQQKTVCLKFFSQNGAKRGGDDNSLTLLR